MGCGMAGSLGLTSVIALNVHFYYQVTMDVCILHGIAHIRVFWMSFKCVMAP